MFNQRKPIRELGKVFEYLQDHKLRVEEKKDFRIEVRDADFGSEELINVQWDRFRFVNCRFPASQRIRVTETTNCWFERCEFGPGRKDVVLFFGGMKDSRFSGCKFANGNVSTRGEASFKDCEFENTTPQSPSSWNYFLTGDTLNLNQCKFHNIDLAADIKLHMKHCDYVSTRVGPIKPGTEYVADIILEDTLIKNAEKFLWNNKLKNLTLKGCQVKGVFSAQESHIKDTLLLEGLKVGSYHFTRCGPDKNLTIRDCHFSEVNKDTTHLFSCSGSYPAETLLERVECTKAATCDLTGAGDGVGIKAEGYRDPVPLNKTFTLRNCKIPHLLVNWLQSYHLIIENCEFGTLELKEGRIGKVTIKNSKFETLNLTRTLAGKYEIDKASTGHIVTAESNYPEGGYKIDGGQQGGQ